MQFLLATPTFTPNDAVSQDLLMQRDVLLARGHEVAVCAENYHPLLRGLAINEVELDQLLAASETHLIYHHSINWSVGFERLLSRFCGRLFVKYHNITPPEFFHPYDIHLEMQTKLGWQQTQDLADMPNVQRYLCDSPYNAKDFMKLGVPEHKLRVVPPFHKAGEIATHPINDKLAQQLKNNERIKVLFVGRVSPNKGHHHLIRTIKRYIEVYGDNIELNIPGSLDINQQFLKELENLVNDHGLGDHVFFHDMASFQDLCTYFANSDIFLLMSEHEGFCVPILEAQVSRLPIIALDRAAVGDTLGANQLIFPQPDYDVFAAAIHTIGSNREYRDYLINHGRANFERFTQAIIAEQLMAALAEE